MKLMLLLAAPITADDFTAAVRSWSAAVVNAFLYFAPIPLFAIVTAHAIYVLIVNHVTGAALDSCIGSLVTGYTSIATLAGIAAVYKAKVAQIAAGPTPAAQVPGLPAPMVVAATKIETAAAADPAFGDSGRA